MCEQKSVDARHLNIAHNKIVGFASEFVKGIETIHGGCHLVAGRLQDRADQFACGERIIGHQQMRLTALRNALGWGGGKRHSSRSVEQFARVDEQDQSAIAKLDGAAETALFFKQWTKRFYHNFAFVDQAIYKQGQRSLRTDKHGGHAVPGG